MPRTTVFRVVLLGLSLGIISSPASATEAAIDLEQPPNSSYLAEYGLSPRIFDTLISVMYQEQTVLRGKYTYTRKIGDEQGEAELELIYDPFFDYGLRLKAIAHDARVYRFVSKSKLKSLIGGTYEKYRSMRHRSVLEEDEVGLIRDDGLEVVLGFRFRKEALPGRSKYMHKMDGTVHLLDGVLDRIELRLAEPDEFQGIDATEAVNVARFQRLPDGGYLLESYVSMIRGTKDGEAAEIVEKLEILEYRDRAGDRLAFFEPQVPDTWTRDGAADTLTISLERSLPFLGNAARKAGYELPLPWGVEAFVHFQTELLGLEKIVLNGSDLTSELLAPGRSSARAHVQLTAARADLWILPFFNVMVMGGYMRGPTEVTLGLTDTAQTILGLDTDRLVINTDTTGPMLGGGATAAGGYKNLFATVNAMFVRQFVTEANTQVDALAVTPLVGWRFPRVLNVITGAQYQIYDSNISGSLELEGEQITFDVELKTKRWNYIIGAQRDFSTRYNAALMIGFEPRPQTTLTVGYRF